MIRGLLNFKTFDEFQTLIRWKYGYDCCECMTQKEAEGYWLKKNQSARNIDNAFFLTMIRDDYYHYFCYANSYWERGEIHLKQVRELKTRRKNARRELFQFRKGLLIIDAWEQTKAKWSEFSFAKPNLSEQSLMKEKNLDRISKYEIPCS